MKFRQDPEYGYSLWWGGEWVRPCYFRPPGREGKVSGDEWEVDVDLKVPSGVEVRGDTAIAPYGYRFVGNKRAAHLVSWGDYVTVMQGGTACKIEPVTECTGDEEPVREWCMIQGVAYSGECGYIRVQLPDDMHLVVRDFVEGRDDLMDEVTGTDWGAVYDQLITNVFRRAGT